MALRLLTLLLPLLAQSPVAAQTRPLTTVTLDVQVTDRSGVPLKGAHVAVEGPSSRAGVTAEDGHVIVRNMAAGTYRVRVECDDFITLEKEVSLRRGVVEPINLALSRTPTPPPPATPAPTPPPTPTPAPSPVLAPATTVPAGEPRVLSIPDLAETAFSGRDPVQEVSLGCSGVGSARLVRVRTSLAAHTHTDADEMLYVVAGAAILNLGGKEQSISTGWFCLVPRGMPHSLTQRGRYPLFVLSSLSGAPCASSTIGSRR